MRNQDDQPEDLDLLLARYIDQLIAGNPLDLEKIAADHPQLADELLEQLEAFRSIGASFEEPVPLGTLGDYTLRRQIGRGGMGVVYEAWQGSMDRVVALKVLPPGVAADNRAFHRFMREAKTAGQLNHQNVVSVYGMGVEQDTPYYSMEYIEGKTLAQVLAQVKDAEPETETRFGPKDSAAYFDKLGRCFADVADGLQHAHSKRVVHRDIKPSNLILDGEGRLRILDFGLARLEGQESLTVSGDLVGTPLYMSPEQARRKKIPIDHRTDVYSLGATMYESLTGRPPFRGKDHHDTLSQIIERDPVEPRKVNHRVPKDLETIVLKCLRKDAADRYGTAEALGQDLRRFVRGDAVEARPETRWELLVRSLWRRRWQVGSSILVFFVLLSAVLLSLNYAERERAERTARYETQVADAVLRIGLDQASFLLGVEQARRRRTQIEYLSGGRITAEKRILAALVDLEEARALAPERPESSYHRARGFVLLRREKDALQELGRLLIVRPDFFPARSLRAAILRRMGKAEDAQSEVQSALADSPSSAHAWIEGQQAMVDGDWPRAIEAYLQLEQVDETPLYVGARFETLVACGMARMETEDYDGALRDFSRALERWPGALAPAILIADVYALQGAEEARERWLEEYWRTAPFKEEAAFEIAVSLRYTNPQLSSRWIRRMEPGLIRDRWLAFHLYWHGERRSAIELGEKALEYEPDNSFTLAVLALAWTGVAEGEDKARSLADLAESLMAQDDSSAAFVLGILHSELRDWKRAADFNRRAVQLVPEWSSPKVNLALNLSAQGKTAESRGVLEEALESAPREPNLRARLCASYQSVGQVTRARECLRHLLDTHPKSDVRANYFLGEIHRKLDELRDAASYYRKCSPGDQYARLKLAGVLSQLGDYDEALTVYCDALPTLANHQHFANDYESLSGLLRWKLKPGNLDCLDRLADTLELYLGQGNRPPHVLESLGLILLSAPERGDPATGLAYCQEAVAADTAQGKQSSRRLSSLATALAANGRPKEAVLTLERALRRGPVQRVCVEQLAEYRHTLRPRAASFASIDALFESDSSDREVLSLRMAELVELAREDDDSAERLLYFEARLREARGQFDEASGTFEALARRVATAQAIEPLHRWVECAARTESSRVVEEFLRERLLDGADPRLFSLWWLVSVRDLEKPLEQLETELAAIIAAIPDGRSEVSRQAQDMLWVVETLGRRGALRINCGLKEDLEENEVRWSRDRFQNGGKRRRRRREESLADSSLTRVLATAREFETDRVASGYRIPLPNGDYFIRLHAAELWYPVGGYRVFDVEAEDAIRGEPCDPAGDGLGHATVREFECSVRDGFLDLVVVPRKGRPVLSAIEIQTLGSE